MAKTMALAFGATTNLISFDDVVGKPRRPDFHNRHERRAEDGTLYISTFGQKLLVETTVVMPLADKTQIHTWHAAGTTLTFYDAYDVGTSSSFNVKLLGNQNPGADKWTKVGDWYQMALIIAEI